MHSSHKLKQIYIDNYRCFVNFKCELSSKQLILGPNGAGKSSLFDVLTALRDFCVRGDPPDELFPESTRTRWQSVPEQTFELVVLGNGSEYQLKLVIDSWGQPARPRVKTEQVTFDGVPLFRFEDGEVALFNDRLDNKEYVRYHFDWHRSALATIMERHDNKKLTWLKNWLGGVLCVAPDPRRMSGVASREVKHPERDLSDFADWFRHFRQETGDHEYQQDLKEIITGFTSMRLEEAGERRREIKVKLGHSEDANKSRDCEYLFSELSDGQRVLIGLYAVLHFAIKPGATICFDEPDNFIALREVDPWLNRILEAVDEEKTEPQVLIASHHPELLNRMAIHDGLLVDRPGGRHVRVQKFRDASQPGLSPAELIARGWESE